MDACAAFEFVFYAGMMQKHADATSLAQATQVSILIFPACVQVHR